MVERERRGEERTGYRRRKYINKEIKLKEDVKEQKKIWLFTKEEY